MPRSATAGPGRRPDRPQPTPKMAAPRTSGRSIAVGVPCTKAGARRGRRSTRVEAEAEEGDDQPAAHDEGEAGVPAAGRNGGKVEEVLDLLRVGHARDGEPDAEDDPGAERGEESGEGPWHQATCLTMKTGDNRRRP